MHKCSREGFNTIPTIESPLPILGLQLCPNPGPAIHLESQACGTLGSQSGSLYFVLQKRVHAVRPHSVASLAHTPPWFHLAHANCFLIPFPPVTVPVNDSVSAVILKAVKEDDSPVGTWSGTYEKCNDSSVYYNLTSQSQSVFQTNWTVPTSEDVTKVNLQVLIVVNRTASKSSVKMEQGEFCCRSSKHLALNSGSHLGIS